MISKLGFMTKRGWHRLSLMGVVAFLVAFSNPGKPATIEAFSHMKEAVSHVTVSHASYRTTFSLGDSLELHGIALSVTNDDSTEATVTSGFTLSGGDTLILGSQSVSVAYGGKTASFDIDVTNERATVKPLVAGAIFISEILSTSAGIAALELYNGTGLPIELDEYELQIAKDGADPTIIALPDVAIAVGDAYVIANDLYDGEGGAAPDLNETTLDFAEAMQIGLFDKIGATIIDVINLTSEALFLGVNDGMPDIDDFHLVRDPKVTDPTTSTIPLEWWLGSTSDTFGSHALQTPTVTIEQQAVSYAAYIMYGIGMNAASNYFNAFYELQEEYGFMDQDAKAYFLGNRRHEISGINESGNLVTNTFNDAIGRYNYLAAKTGNPGLTNSSSWFDELRIDDFGKAAIVVAIVLVAGAIYVYTKKRWSL